MMTTFEPGSGDDPVSDAKVMVLVLDASGSMREHGKSMLARNLVTHLIEQRRSAEERWQLGPLVVIRWGTETSVVDLRPDEDLPPIAVGGRAQALALLPVLEGLVPGEGALRVLLLSDGHVEAADVAAFKAWQRGNPRVSVRALAVGPDAMSATLAKMTHPGGVFAPEEVIEVVTTWTLPRDPTLPVSLAEVTAEAAGDQR
jgi:hypothetical protein